MNKTNLTAILIFLFGGIGVFSFFTQNLPLMARVNTVGTIPLPLVFDGPKGYQFLANQYHFKITTNKQTIDLPITKEVYQNFPTNMIYSTAIISPIAMIPLFPKTQWYPIIQKIFCEPEAEIKRFLPQIPQEETIKTAVVTITGLQNTWIEEVKCL